MFFNFYIKYAIFWGCCLTSSSIDTGKHNTLVLWSILQCFLSFSVIVMITQLLKWKFNRTIILKLVCINLCKSECHFFLSLDSMKTFPLCMFTLKSLILNCSCNCICKTQLKDIWNSKSGFLYQWLNLL